LANLPNTLPLEESYSGIACSEDREGRGGEKRRERVEKGDDGPGVNMWRLGALLVAAVDGRVHMYRWGDGGVYVCVVLPPYKN
jgi:hypothetical protein